MLVDFPVRQVFTQFKYYVATEAPDVSEILPRIKSAANRYRAIIEGAQQASGVLSRVELFSYRVGTLDSEIARPLLIWLDEPEQAGVTDADRDRILATLESWFVRRALVKAPSQGANRFMVDLLKHVSGKPVTSIAAEVEAYLLANHSTVGYWPGDQEVRDALTQATAYWKYVRARLRMVLEALEDCKRGYPNGARLAMGPIVRGKGTIEHLMPQRWRQHWMDDLTTEQSEARDRRVQYLGNLTLVTQPLNSRVSNGSWEMKRGHFQEVNDVLLTNEAMQLAGDAAWNEGTIEQRTGILIERILEVWPAPAGHVGLVAAEPQGPSTVTVDVAQLVASGWLDAGTKLFALPAAFKGSEATLAQDGHIYVASQAGYDTPTGAACAINGGAPVNGWRFWQVSGTTKTLADVRTEYLQSLGQGDAEVIDEVPSDVAQLDLEGEGATDEAAE